MKVFAAVVSLVIVFLMGPRSAQAADFVFYDEVLPSGWLDGSWNTQNNLLATQPAPRSGSVYAEVAFSNAYGAFAIANWNQAASTTGYNALSFSVRGSSSARYLELFIEGQGGSGRTSVPLPDVPAQSWIDVIVFLADLGSPGSITRLGLMNDSRRMDWTNVGNPEFNTPFHVDNLRLTNAPLPPPPPPQAGPALRVDATAHRKPISPFIYGVNWENQQAFAREIATPVNRWGGDATPRYNPQNRASNPGFNWYFKNAAGSDHDAFIGFNRSVGAQTIMTLPMIGWAAKDSTSCGFSIAKYGAQNASDGDCGSGLRSDGSPITGNDPRDSSVAVNTEFYRPWIQSLVATYGRADAGGVRFYNLDNETGIWNGTHRDLVVTAPSHTELLSRSIAAATMLKSVDSSAQVLGPAEDGWTRYLLSGLDSQNGNWGATYDGLWAVEWYLKQMRAHEQASGQRLLDYLDLHYYPQAVGVYGTAGGKDTQALRLRTVRSLWDPSYVDESWISTTGISDVRLLRRMRGWVDTHYPGTKLAITEYNFGALDHINGALAQADVLGVFGREGVDLATLWGPPETWAASTGLFSSKPGGFALRMYRNVDGAGAGFGDTSVEAASDDQGRLSVYGSVDSRDGSLKAMVINKTDTPLISTLSLKGFNANRRATLYRYSAANLGAIQKSSATVAAGGVSTTFPPNSITLVKVPPRAR